MFITGPDVIKTVTGEDVDDRGARRRAGAQHQERRRALHGHRRAGLRSSYVKCAAVLPAVEQPRRRRRCSTPDGAGRRARRPRARHARSRTRPTSPTTCTASSSTSLDDGEFLEVQALFAPNILVRLRPGRGPPGRRRRQPADAVRRLPRHRRLREGGALRPDLRRVQHPGADLRRRARLPARHRPGVGRHHPARRQADLRLLRGDRPEGHGHHPQGLRRRVRRHGLQAPRRRHQLRLADRADRGHGRAGRGQHHLPQGARRRRGPRGDRAPSSSQEYEDTLRRPVHRGRARLRRRGDRAVGDPGRGRSRRCGCCAPSGRPCRRRSTGTSRCERARAGPARRARATRPTQSWPALVLALRSAATTRTNRTGRSRWVEDSRRYPVWDAARWH